MEDKSKNMTTGIEISRATFKRLPVYYCYLKEREKKGNLYISSTTIAESLRLKPIQVRKDLAVVSNVSGKPRMGFEIHSLLQDLETILGYNNVDEAVLVGVGQLGKALLSYEGFKDYGLNIVVGFDSNPNIVGAKIHEKTILHVAKMESMIKRLGINIGIITVPKNEAQNVCDIMIRSGIKAIWNFVPVHLEIPENVIIRNENLAASFSVLSEKLAKSVDL